MYRKIAHIISDGTKELKNIPELEEPHPMIAAASEQVANNSTDSLYTQQDTFVLYQREDMRAHLHAGRGGESHWVVNRQ